MCSSLYYIIESIVFGNSVRKYSTEFMTKLWDPDWGFTAQTSVLLLLTMQTEVEVSWQPTKNRTMELRS